MKLKFKGLINFDSEEDLSAFYNLRSNFKDCRFTLFDDVSKNIE
jgi:hypothetical protein